MELIEKKTDCALRCLAVLAKAHGKQVVCVRKLAKQQATKTGISEDLLHKIMHTLGRAKLVRATRGRTGGLRLVKPPEQITVLDVVEALQGPFAVNYCFTNSKRLRNKFVSIQKKVLDVFGEISLAELIHSDDKRKGPGPRKRK